VPTAPFTYERAGSFAEAVALLQALGEDARVIAGGQSLVPLMLLRFAQPAALVDIRGAGERAIERTGDRLVISALARHADIEASPEARSAWPILAEAAGQIGNVRVRHRGTIGGSLAHAEASAEWPCVAVALGATVHVLGPAGERAIAARDLVITHLTTSLEPGEVITRIELPLPAPGEGAAFAEYARRPGDFALLTVAAVVRPGSARVVLGAIADRPIDASAAAGDGSDPEAAGRAVAAGVEIGPHPHAGVEWRRELIAVLVTRALEAARERA
jgi:CO/xanthine dehydrogenase FAD-binding subunit